MPAPAPSSPVALTARQRFCKQVGVLLPLVGADLREHLRLALELAKSARDMQEARDTLVEVESLDSAWIDGVRASLRQQLSQRSDQPPQFGHTVPGRLELLGTEAVEEQLLASRLALSLQDTISQPWADLRLRLQMAQGNQELDPGDVIRPEALARILVSEWIYAGLSRTTWSRLQGHLHKSLSRHLSQAYLDANEFLVAQGVMPRIDLRPLVRKAPSAPSGGGGSAGPIDSPRSTGSSAHGGMGNRTAPAAGQAAPELWVVAKQQALEVLERLKHLMPERFLPPSGSGQGQGAMVAQRAHASPALRSLLQQTIPPSSDTGNPPDNPVSARAKVAQAHQFINQRSAALKQAADTPGEKAVIELVALMFQSIVNEERIPPSLRLWFARLQMPVLRLALADPEFFSSLQHPARRLIDRMGSCALGFDANLSEDSAQALEAEIKRVVQVIEQYPDTGRRVFQIALDEFQAFLAKHLQARGSTGRLVSVAQQVEQKETLAVQYTIELRQQLDDMPVRDEIRNFFFRVWAEVLAVATIKFGVRHVELQELKRVATDLLWAASAKPTRPERAQVIAQLPGLLGRLRKGMGLLGLATAQQEAHIKVISDILADAFMSRTQAIQPERLAALTRHLSELEAFLPTSDMDDLSLELNQDSIELITGVDASRIEVVTHGGRVASPSTKVWAHELQTGAWFRLDHNSQVSQVQLSWRSEGGQLYLFTTAMDRHVLIQLGRVAAYLQAGLLVPVEEQPLTVRATQAALDKLDANPERLLH